MDDTVLCERKGEGCCFEGNLRKEETSFVFSHEFPFLTYCFYNELIIIFLPTALTNRRIRTFFFFVITKVDKGF